MGFLAAEFGHLDQSAVQPFVGEGVWEGNCSVMEIMAFLLHFLPKSTELL